MEIRNILNFKTGDWIDNKSLQEKLQMAFNKVGLVKKARPSDIKSFYNAKPQQQRVNSVQVNGYKIL